MNEIMWSGHHMMMAFTAGLHLVLGMWRHAEGHTTWVLLHIWGGAFALAIIINELI